MKKDGHNYISPRKKALMVISIMLTFTLAFAVGCSHKETENEDSSFEAYGVINEISSYNPSQTLKDGFYYNEAWFDDSPEIRNDALALISMQLVAAATDKNEASNAAKAFSTLGFEKVGFADFETDDPDDCAYTYATKKLGDCTLVAVVVQSYAFDKVTKVKGWKQNFLVNDETASGEHAAFKKAAEKALDDIASLGGKKAKYWITGHSRGGALANLIAAKLPEKLGNVNAGIFAYTFESPATTEASLAKTEPQKYAYIHNYLAGDDIVPLVPMWGMVRYGNEYELRTEKTELSLFDELERLGSGAAEADYDLSLSEGAVKELAGYLEDRVGSRADYSALKRDVFFVDENEVTVGYSYQNAMLHLMGAIFSGEFGDLSYDLLSDNKASFASSVFTLVAALKAEQNGNDAEAAKNYYETAQGVLNVVNGLAENSYISLDEIDFYALLRLFAPKAIDLGHEAEGDDVYDVSCFIAPLIDFAMSAGRLVFAHHFEVVNARLKALAPLPEAESFAISVAEPKNGDPVNLFAEEFKNETEGQGLTWLTVGNAGWNENEKALENGSIYYFNAELEIVGHRVPKTFAVNIGGKAPVEVTCEYASGVETVSLKWEYAVGTPDTALVTFATGNGAQAPSAVTVGKGKMLKYVSKPEIESDYTENGKTYIFEDWTDGEGKKWSDITVKGDEKLFAKWIEVVDEVEIYFDIPSVDDGLPYFVLPENAPYEIREWHVYDENYRPVEEITEAGNYEVSLFITALDGVSVFKEAVNEYGETEFEGAVTVNCEECGSYYYEYIDGVAFLAVFISLTVE